MPTVTSVKSSRVRSARRKITRGRPLRAKEPVAIKLTPEEIALENAILQAAARDVALLA